MAEPAPENPNHLSRQQQADAKRQQVRERGRQHAEARAARQRDLIQRIDSAALPDLAEIWFRLVEGLCAPTGNPMSDALSAFWRASQRLAVGAKTLGTPREALLAMRGATIGLPGDVDKARYIFANDPTIVRLRAQAAQEIGELLVEHEIRASQRGDSSVPVTDQTSSGQAPPASSKQPAPGNNNRSGVGKPDHSRGGVDYSNAGWRRDARIAEQRNQRAHAAAMQALAQAIERQTEAQQRATQPTAGAATDQTPSGHPPAAAAPLPLIDPVPVPASPTAEDALSKDPENAHLLMGWKAILAEMGRDDTRANQVQIKRLTKKYKGPINWEARPVRVLRGKLWAWLQVVEKETKRTGATSPAPDAQVELNNPHEMRERGFQSKKRPNNQGTLSKKQDPMP